MTRKGILFFLTVVILSCCHGNRALVQENTASDIVEASPLDSIFVSPRLQDSLRAFMELTDSISHSYWIKKTYQIIISKYDNFEQDTLIDIVLGGLTPMVIDIDYNPAGAVEDSSKVISVGYIHFDSLSEVVNERVLSMGLYNEYDVWNEKNQTWEDIRVFRTSVHYKLSGLDSLVLLSKYFESKVIYDMSSHILDPRLKRNEMDRFSPEYINKLREKQSAWQAEVFGAHGTDIAN